MSAFEGRKPVACSTEGASLALDRPPLDVTATFPSCEAMLTQALRGAIAEMNSTATVILSNS